MGMPLPRCTSRDAPAIESTRAGVSRVHAVRAASNQLTWHDDARRMRSLSLIPIPPGRNTGSVRGRSRFVLGIYVRRALDELRDATEDMSFRLVTSSLHVLCCAEGLNRGSIFRSRRESR
ncbi:hypothetical protein KM043_006990 [Ampulex compressa]|nr:hypothetical protein KM043_006990 [Ampulex compressa]